MAREPKLASPLRKPWFAPNTYEAEDAEWMKVAETDRPKTPRAKGELSVSRMLAEPKSEVAWVLTLSIPSPDELAVLTKFVALIWRVGWFGVRWIEIVGVVERADLVCLVEGRGSGSRGQTDGPE